LAIAGARYWTTVAPRVRTQLERWELRALSIPDPLLRALATGKLRDERLNVELAATFACSAPRARRRLVVDAIVALQVAYDYLDALGEQHTDLRHCPDEDRPGEDHPGGDRPDEDHPGEDHPDRPGEDHPGGDRPDEALVDAVSLDGGARSDDGYVAELITVVRHVLAQLPSTATIERTVRRAAERCARAQALAHAASSPACVRALQEWATREAQGSRLGWLEWLAGAQASVLCMHALIAAAADADTTPGEAAQLDDLYLTISALTMLDSLVDHAEDTRAGALRYAPLYRSFEQMGLALCAAAQEGLRRAQAAPHSGRHAMTLAGIVAHYASAPSASSPSAQPVIVQVQNELRPLIVPVLALMRASRLAGRQRPTSARHPAVGIEG
jgi:hypothetical protein